MEQNVLLWWLVPAFFIAAMLYSSVGHGGASAYLGILALAGLKRPDVAPVVLVLNILVAGTGVFAYTRAGHFSASLLLPFVLASVPAAYLGGRMDLSPEAFSTVLGLTLLAAGLRFIVFDRSMGHRPPASRSTVFVIGLPAGFGLGFLAGLIGIGGGIFLSPLLLLTGWADAKKTAAVSAAFIVINSISGLTAHMVRESVNLKLLLPLAAAVMVGASAGSLWGAFRIPPVALQRLLGTVLLMASAKMLWGLI